MKKMLVSFVLDETGSMEIVKSQTISGFNEYIDTLKKDKRSQDILFTMTKFNSEKVEVVYDSVSIDKVVHLGNDTYNPNSLTPLYDAIGRTMNSVECKVTGKKQPVLLIIQTDGEENASKEFTREKIFAMIEEKKKVGWTFVFLGANQDAWLTSQTLGIPKGNTLSYDGADTTNTFNKVAMASSHYLHTDGTQTDSYFTNDKNNK